MGGGLYVNAAHCLQIVQAPDRDAATVPRWKWTVCAATTASLHGKVMVIEADAVPEEDKVSSPTSVVLRCLDDETDGIRGSYDGDTQILKWEDGDVWHPLHVSDMQASLMMRRPYVPITVLFLFCVQKVVAIGGAWLRSALVPSSKPPACSDKKG